MADDNEFDAAVARAERRRQTGPTAVAARYDRRIGRVVIRLSSRLEVAFAPHDAQGLETARPAQLDEIEISPSGFGIHFPKLDADIYLPALLEGFLGSRQWMAARAGVAGRPATSAANAATVRSKGQPSGRRRKTVGG